MNGVRQDALVPRKVHPLIALPRDVDEALQVVRFQLRVELIRWLASNPHSQVSEIVDGIGSERATIRRHLDALEQTGVIRASLPPGSRERERVTYQVDITRWRELLDKLKEYPESPV